jgi:glycosyltransferase involved in cell wall biosynthesis
VGVPAVSVVIPAFNAERHIAEALGSVRDQTLRDVEVIVVDDGSRDGTLREVQKFAGKMDLIVVAQANAGASAARNAGIVRARGRYCAFLDADDLMLPERLAVQKELLDAQPDLGLVHTDLMTFDERGTIHQTRRAFSDPCGGMVLDRLLLDNFITTSTVMAWKDRVIEAGMFNVNRRISHDLELWLRMAARWKVAYIERPLVRYRYLPGSLSDDKVATARDALDVIVDFWREHPQDRRDRPRVYRTSLAKQLAAAGDATLARGSRGGAIAYLMRSLRLNPWNLRSWKSLTKAFVLPSRSQPPRDASVGGAASS